MQSHDSFSPAPTTGSRSASRNTLTRYVLPLFLLVLVIGGMAYLTQHLREHRSKNPIVPVLRNERNLVEFVRTEARWDKSDAKNFKEFETGMQGHYDFPFRNIAGEDVELGLQSTDCDCASVHVSILPAQEWQRLVSFQEESPGEPLPYVQEPRWQLLSADPKSQPYLLKPNDHGIVRTLWNARKPPGTELRLKPRLWSQPAGKPEQRTRHDQFTIPGVMSRPVNVYPQRVSVGVLSARDKATAEFDVFSPTREKLDLQFVSAFSDPLLVIDSRPLSAAERADLESNLRSSNVHSRVLSGYHVTVTVHEQREGIQLEQGAFLRKVLLVLDGIQDPELPGPEVSGRVLGDILIGGAKDQGRIHFKSFDSTASAFKVVNLMADARLMLEPFKQHPVALEVDLKRDLKNSTSERSRWQLKVTVPSNSFSGSFTDADAVTLRIVNDPRRVLPQSSALALGHQGLPGYGPVLAASSFFLEQPRFVRIPLEGHVGGNR